MQKVKMKYIGTVSTRVLVVRGAEKVEVNVGDVVEMDKEIAEEIAKTYKGVWVTEAQAEEVLNRREEGNAAQESKGEIKLPEAPVVEGELDESHVEKTVPKKTKKSN